MLSQETIQNMYMETEKEFLKCFDDQGNVIEPQPRNVVHTKPYSIWHGIVDIWLLNDKGEILCTKRSEKLEGNPGKWETYLGGHVRSEHDFLETAQREISEEVGLYLNTDDFKLVTSGKREDFMHVYERYAVLFNGDTTSLNFADEEITEARWFSFDEYISNKKDHTDNWCNSITDDLYKKALEVLGL